LATRHQGVARRTISIERVNEPFSAAAAPSGSMLGSSAQFRLVVVAGHVMTYPKITDTALFI
jgi:hypothetical protein